MNNLDDLFKNKLEHNGLEFQEGYWNEMEELIDSENKKKRRFILFFSTLFIVLIGSMMGFLFNGNNEKLAVLSSTPNASLETNTNCMQISYNQLPNFDKQKTVLQVEFKGKNKQTVAYHYFVKPKELLLEKPTIEIKIVGETLIEVKTNTLAKNVYLQTGEASMAVNYFDLIPGFPKIIKMDKPINSLKTM